MNPTPLALVAAATTLAMGPIALAQTTTIDFEDLVVGDGIAELNLAVEPLGVRFDAASPGALRVTLSGSNAIEAPTTPPQADVLIIFDPPVSVVRARMLSSGVAVSLTAYDIVASPRDIIGETPVDYVRGPGPTTLEVRAPLIRMVQLESNATTVLFDDVEFAPQCLADMDADGELTVFDFLAFQNAFDAGDLVADFDGDGALTLFDFLAFQNAFDRGCP